MKTYLVVSLALLGLQWGAVSIHAAPGDLDPSFGNGGKLTMHVGGSGSESAQVVAVQQDGKIVMVGYASNGSYSDFALVRCHADGTLDSSFGVGGKVITSIRSGNDYGQSVALQDDGKIVVAGYSYLGDSPTFALARYGADGTLDSSFASGGITTLSLGGMDDRAYCVALQPDGKIVVAGDSWNGSKWVYALARYNADGTLDSSFGAGGTTRVSIGGSSSDQGRSVAVQSDGKIVVAGHSWIAGSYDFVLIRCRPNGTLDSSFNSGGVVATPTTGNNEQATSMALQPDGKIVVAGVSGTFPNQDFMLARYHSYGALDSSFGTDGMVTTPLGSGNDHAASVVLQADGKIVLAGTSSNGSNNDFALVRYNTDGTLDSDFGTGGKTTTDFGGSDDWGFSVALQADGNIVVGGSSGQSFALARFKGTVITSPEIAVSGNGANITNHDSSPDISDHTDFGITFSNGGVVSRTFTIKNMGGAVLNLTGTPRVALTGSSAFAVTAQPGSATLEASGGLATFTITYAPTAVGTHTATVSIANDDSDENPFTFSIMGAVAPEIALSGNGVSIANGDTTPNMADHTDFGSINTTGGSVQRTFTIINNGGAVLNLTGTPHVALSGSSAFSVAIQPVSSTVAEAGGTSDFTINFDPATHGAHAATVSIASNDSDENPFTFAISGMGVAPGGLDLTFNGTGKVITPILNNEEGRSVAVQSDGKIVVAGNANPSANSDFALVRYRADGMLDSSFGTGGKVTTAIGGGTDVGNGVAVQPDGKIVVAGRASIGGSEDFALARYTANGTLDTSFGTGGVVTTPIGSGNDQGRSVALQSDGKIVVAGHARVGSTDDIALVRYNLDGTLDNSFGAGGKVTTPVGSSADIGTSLVLQNDGKIVVAGYARVGSTDDFALVRYNADGTLDSTFGTAGKVTTPIGAGQDQANSVALQSDSKIVVAGIASNGSNNDFALVCYNLDGTLDSSFGTGGKVTTPVGSSNDYGYSVAVKPDGRIVLAGSSHNGSNLDFALLQYGGTAVVTAPEIALSGNSANINNGDSIPDIADHTDFGITTVIGGTMTRTFTIANSGGAALNLAGIPLVALSGSSAFSVTTQPTSSSVVASGGTVTFSITYDPSAVGTHTATVSIANDDSDENPFSFTIMGAVAPEIALSGNGVNIAHGDITPGTMDHTDFGSVLATGGPVQRTFTIINNGTAILNLTSTPRVGLSGSSAFSVAAQPASATITDGGGTSDFTISFDPAIPGAHAATVSIANNDSDENPFTFAITGTGTGPGDLDLAFNAMGQVTTPVGSGGDFGNSVAVQNDGKIVVAGYANIGGNEDFALVRYNHDGTLDSSFGTRGKVTTSVGSSYDIGNSVAMQSDGKIVAAGYANIGGNEDFALVRYNHDGTLDSSFGTGGKVTTPVGSGEDIGNSLVLQNDGKIVLAGRAHNGSNRDFALVRYNNDGTLDSSFGAGGKVTTPVGSGDDYGNTVALQADGKIVVAGYARVGSTDDFALARYNADGTLDSTFGTAGKVTTPIGAGGDQANSVALQSDGKIIAVGTASNGSDSDIALVCYNTDGTLDSNFGPGGKVVTPIGSSNDIGNSVVVQSNGKIVVAGDAYNGSNSDIALARYNTDGTLDISFSFDGKVTTPVGSSYAVGNSVALQSDGKIVVAGYALVGSNYDFALLRYLGDPPLTPLTIFQAAMAAYGLNGPEAGQEGTPHHDGTSNLLKYAFNMNLTGADASTMTPGGNGGLPSILAQPNGGNSIFRFEFVRRIGSGLIYTPQKAGVLDNASAWEPLMDAPTIIAMNANWERVIYEEPYDVATTPRCFGRVQVTLPP
jgi:uncharacterized delta-60 repeat protein